jgi:hypothetical protein
MRAFDEIMEQLDWPPIYLVSAAQFESVEGDKVHGLYGLAATTTPIITIHKGLKGKVLKSTLWHEIGHHLFPSKPHWWVEAFGEKMARGGGVGYYCRQHGHSVDDLPPRARLLRLAQLAAKRLNKKEK